MRVSALATATAVTVRTIRYYESVGLLTPSVHANGYRDYTDDDVQRVALIRRLQASGFSLAEIRDLAPCWQGDRTIGGGTVEQTRAFFATKLADVTAQIDALTDVRHRLETSLRALDHTATDRRDT